MIRANNNSQKPGASPATRVPAQNSDIASRKTVRVATRSSRKPVVGMTTAIVSRNALVSHCTVLAETDSSVISVGRATAMIVSLRMTTKVATSRIVMTVRAGAGNAGLTAISPVVVTL